MNRRLTILTAGTIGLALICAAAVAALAHNAAADTPSPWDEFHIGVVITQSGSNMQLWTTTVPDHGSPYFYQTDPMYEPYNGSNPNFQLNPNHIGTQSLLFTIPANPQVAAVHQATPLGPIGIALNGVPFFNQYAGPGQPLTNEINSFDQYDGHPQQTSMYHYHWLPLSLVAESGPSSLLGFLLDGFPVYGPVENGVTLTSADLDQYHGHFGPTPEYPDGIYHYNITADSPYINGAGFYGTPGTVVIGAATPAVTASPTPSPSPSPSPSPTAAPCSAQTMPWPVPTGDDDCDGYTTARENFIGTLPLVACSATAGPDHSPDEWPVDYNNDQAANLTDIFIIIPHLNTLDTDAGSSPRYDLSGEGAVNLTDIFLLVPFLNMSCAF